MERNSNKEKINNMYDLLKEINSHLKIIEDLDINHNKKDDNNINISNNYKDIDKDIDKNIDKNS